MPDKFICLLMAKPHPFNYHPSGKKKQIN